MESTEVRDDELPPNSGNQRQWDSRRKKWDTDPVGELLRMARDWRYSDEFLGQVFRFRSDAVEKQLRKSTDSREER